MAAARQGTPQRGSGGWPPDIKPCLCVTMKSVLNAKPPLTASAYSASLRLCVKHLYTFYMFYTANHLSTTSQCPPLSGPMRRMYPCDLSQVILFSIAVCEMPIPAMSSNVVTIGFLTIMASILLRLSPNFSPNFSPNLSPNLAEGGCLPPPAG